MQSLSADIEINDLIIKLLEGQGVLFFILGLILFLITLKVSRSLFFNYMLIPLIIMTFFSIYYYNYFQSQSLIYMIILHLLILVVSVFDIIELKRIKK